MSHLQLSEPPETASHLSHDQTPLLNHNKISLLDPLVVRFLERLHAKPIKYTEQFFSFEIQPGAYADCLKTLEQDDNEVWGYLQDNFKADLVNNKELIIKMSSPSALHEGILFDINRLIITQLNSLFYTSNDTKKLVLDIRGYRATDVVLQDGYKCPDDQFEVKGFAYPGVIIEVSYSQTLNALSQKAKGYFNGSNGGIQVVIGVKLKYYKSEDDLSIHIWRRGEKVLEETIIKGNTVYPGLGKIQLKDFAPQHELKLRYPNADLGKEIILDYEDLARSYQVHVERQARQKGIKDQAGHEAGQKTDHEDIEVRDADRAKAETDAQRVEAVAEMIEAVVQRVETIAQRAEASFERAEANSMRVEKPYTLVGVLVGTLVAAYLCCS